MSWHMQRMALFDLETTGVDPYRDRIVTAALIEAGGGRSIVTHDWLINPGIPIPQGASDIHGITTDHATTHGVTPADAVTDIVERILALTAVGVPVVGHNVTYDLTMLWAEAVRHHPARANDIATIAPVVDTFVMDKWMDKWRKGSRKLVDVTAHYGIDLSEADAHGAAADALAAGRLAWKLAQRWTGLQQFSLPELHQAQIEEKREQAESFGAYLTRQGKTDDVAREWPIQPPPAGWDPSQLPGTREQVSA